MNKLTSVVLAVVAAMVALVTPFLLHAIDKGNVLRKVPPQGPLQQCHPLLTQDVFGCEDMAMDRRREFVLLACGNREARSRWFPPLGRLDKGKLVAEKGWNDQLWVYFLKNKTLIPLTIRTSSTWQPGTDLRLHGISMFDSAGGESITIGAVNHRREGGSVVELFRGRPWESAELEHVETVRDPVLMRTPNDLVLVSHRSFYVTNDHYYAQSGWMRTVEEFTARPWGTVVFSEQQGMKGVREQRVVIPGIPYPNGIVVVPTAVPGEDEVWVSSSTGGYVAVYRRERHQQGALTFRMHLSVPFLPDNLDRDPTSGAVYVTGHVRLLNFKLAVHRDRLPNWMQAWVGTHLAPISTVARITNATGQDVYYGHPYRLETILVDDGRFQAATIAVADASKQRVLIGGLQGYGIHQCLLGG